MISKPKSLWLIAVERAVRSIPRGKTASYARVALMAGKPGAARAVVQALHRLEGIPWWRVIRSDGTLAPAVAAEQRRHLAREGTKLSPPLSPSPRGGEGRGEGLRAGLRANFRGHR